MTTLSELPHLQTADAHFVTESLLVGGDLDTLDVDLAVRQLDELVDVGTTHILDVRIEWSDEQFVRERAPGITYLHAGIDDAGQRVPGWWFDAVVEFALQAIEAGGRVLAHCHMGINRGPSTGFAILLAQGWDPVDAMDAIRGARDVAYIAYADDALVWHHQRLGSEPAVLAADLRRVAAWRAQHHLDLEEVIRRKRAQTPGD